MALIDSSVVAGFTYVEESRTLSITFHDGTKYAYLDVPSALVEEFKKAPSKGLFFNNHIRDRFETKCLEKPLPPMLLDNAIFLVSEALSALTTRQIGKASWRLADALGEIRDKVKQLDDAYSVEGITTPTGKGFQIVDIKDFTA